MGKNYAVGIDLGGTNLRVGIVGSDGRVKKSLFSEIGKDKSVEAVLKLISSKINELKSLIKVRLVGCGCGIPGIIDQKRGFLYSSPNLPLWVNLPILSLLEKKIKMKVVADNDVNMFALAELIYGAGKGKENLIAVTLGSGIGGGLIIDGKIFHGDHGFAGEVGHMIVEPDGAKCLCGGRGCWEQYAASNAFRNLIDHLPRDAYRRIVSLAGEDLSTLTPLFMSKLAGDGNQDAKALWDLFGRYLGIGIASLVNILGISTVVIGGGITDSWDLFINETLSEISKRTYKETYGRLQLVKSSLGGETGIVGAASAIFKVKD